MATLMMALRTLGRIVRPSVQSHVSRAALQPRSWRTGISGQIRTLIMDRDAQYRKEGETPGFAFAFDIDGVLLHVAKPIPGASDTLKYLQKEGIPFILLTNGGGKHERERVAELSDKLGVELSIENFVQSHTPFQQLVHQPWSENSKHLKDKNILVTGSDASKSRLIAEAYGFQSVITPADILVAHPTIYPFEPLLDSHYKATARPLPEPNPKIDAIFVFNDPRDWSLDTQIIMDLLLSKEGVLGTYSPKNGKKQWQQDGQPPLYFSNPDLFWSASYHLPRFGQGAFQAALAGMWAKITEGRELKSTIIGKPYNRTYAYAENVLTKWRERSGPVTTPLRRVYMVGDNPESDIRGANNRNTQNGRGHHSEAVEWYSILVKTGVWDRERDGWPKYKPSEIVDDVSKAVEWAVDCERTYWLTEQRIEGAPKGYTKLDIKSWDEGEGVLGGDGDEKEGGKSWKVEG
ncbi:HAD-superfamily subfamily IIA hydrolase [Xylariaceae sp. FL1272]|nr:HAD-superfamily subfamily IIA hydrolase [Xylariaceae sp. FL1272]